MKDRFFYAVSACRKCNGCKKEIRNQEVTDLGFF